MKLPINHSLAQGAAALASIAVALVAVLLAVAALAPSFAHAAVGPAWDVKAIWGDTNLPAGGEGEFQLQVRNLGEEGSEEALRITDHLPAGVTANKIQWGWMQPGSGGGPEEPFKVPMQGEFSGFPVQVPVDLTRFCSGTGTDTVTCVVPKETTIEMFGFPVLVRPMASFKPYPQDGVPGYPGGYLPSIRIDVDVAPDASGTATNTARIEGGGNAQPFDDVNPVPFSAVPSSFGIRPGSFEGDVFTGAYPEGAPSRQAGDHPFEQRLNFQLNQETGVGEDGTRYVTANGLLKTVDVTLPRGMIGNPEALPKCEPVDFATGTISSRASCPPDTQVGYISVRILWGTSFNGHGGGGSSFSTTKIAHVPVYSLNPPKGTPVDLAFDILGVVQGHVYAALDPAHNYAIKAVTPDISQLTTVRDAELTLWGVPGDPAHDKFRYFLEGPGHKGEEGRPNSVGAPWGSAPIRPFYTNPSDCGFDNGGHRIRVDSYQHPGAFSPVQENPAPDNVTGCDDSRFRFEPEISLEPTDHHAAAPTGLDVHLKVPQRNDEVEDAKELYAQNGFVKGISTPPMKKALITFPDGMTINPSAAQGLGSCTPAEIGLGTDSPVRCPESSQYGTLTLHTPILPVNEQPHGYVYVAKQGDNPFHNFLSLYLVVEEPDRGILVKIPGRVDLDPDTGQITTTFEDLPQFPVSDMEINLKSGLRAGLVNPQTCGRKVIEAVFYSWQDPSTPHHVSSSYDVASNPDGSHCHASLGERQFKPQLDAGTENPSAATYSPFLFRLTRTDEDQEFSKIRAVLPEGLLAKFAGVSVCPDSAIAQAEHRTGAGEGTLEQNAPSCPDSSQIGTTEVGTGVGVPLAYVPGKVYLAGPYNGAPLSMVVVSPAVLGPYDLGVISVRTAIKVDRSSAQATAISDPFPQIFQGIPVRIRDIRLQLDRREFTLNPSSCAAKQIDAQVTGTGAELRSSLDDTNVELRERFQAADCASLPFKPKLSLRLKGPIRRTAHPRLIANLTAKPGESNIARAQVKLPRAAFLDNAHIRGVCTKVQFAADTCPRASVYGKAWAKTPLLDQRLEGPVYLRSSNHLLPDLVVKLHGPDSLPIEIDLLGRTDSVNSALRNTFEAVPDAPVSKFHLELFGGKRGLIELSSGLCAHPRAAVELDGHNGKTHNTRPVVRSSCSRTRVGDTAHNRTKPAPLLNPHRPPTARSYIGRGKGIKKATFRLQGHKLIEARIAFFERCTTRGGGQGRRYRLRQELDEASWRSPLRVDGRGRFRFFRWEVGPSSDERELFAGKVTSRSIVGSFARESNGSASESGISDKCHTGPYGEPMKASMFYAWRR